MTDSLAYPPSPSGIPDNLTKPRKNFRIQAMLAMLGLITFMILYFVLFGCFAWITYQGGMNVYLGQANLVQMVFAGSALLLSVFMLKSLFAVRKSGSPGGIEVTEQDEPKLFSFLHQLADEIGAPRPHRVFITPEVNAAVFYDLSLMNLIFPSKKNLIIGLGLVNVLTLDELKAVLAHEFGHFAQGSMMVGRWVYIAQQIIAHMVVTRDWLDSIVRFISRIDLRIAWLGWLLALIIWSIRSLVDTLFGLVIIAERALSREMEFNADLVAVSVTGSDALINALYKLQAADHAWQTSLNIASGEAQQGNTLNDLFHAQKATIEEMRRVLCDKSYGKTPDMPEDCDPGDHRVFSEEMARPPQMWSTHPPNRDREDNAKNIYIEGAKDAREAWTLFANPSQLRREISSQFYNLKDEDQVNSISPLEAVIKRFNRSAYAPEYRGTYLNRSIVREFVSIEEMLNAGSEAATAEESLRQLYPESIMEDLKTARNLDIERDTLEALERGDLKPSGGVIRHRGEELKKSEIPEAIKQIVEDRQLVSNRLKDHDATCRRAHLQGARQLGGGWYDYLRSLIELLHCSEHMEAKVEDEQALLLNTWAVITADKQIGYFEKRRMIRVCKKIFAVMNEVSDSVANIQLPEKVASELGVENWAEQCPQFGLVDVTNKNWMDWCKAASESMAQMERVLNMIKVIALEELIHGEELIREHLQKQTPIDAAPSAGACPQQYPLLMPGDENTLQRKLDLWNRFQLAHGFMPATARLIVSLGIVGGTIVGGFLTI